MTELIARDKYLPIPSELWQRLEHPPAAAPAVQMIVIPSVPSRNGHHCPLTLGRSYEVLGIEADFYRLLVDETEPWNPNDPHLFEPSHFTIAEPAEPQFWLCRTGEDGERYCYPTEWSRVGFFEEYHDRVGQVRSQFWAVLKRLYPWTWRDRRFDEKEPT